MSLALCCYAINYIDRRIRDCTIFREFIEVILKPGDIRGSMPNTYKSVTYKQFARVATFVLISWRVQPIFSLLILLSVRLLNTLSIPIKQRAECHNPSLFRRKRFNLSLLKGAVVLLKA